MTTPPSPDITAHITSDELANLIEAIAGDNLPTFQSLMSGKRRYGAKTFEHEAALRMTQALDQLGFCWARPPQDHDSLYDDIVTTLYDIGQVERLSLTSDNEHVRQSSSRTVAMHMMAKWRESKTAVVRRIVETLT